MAKKASPGWIRAGVLGVALLTIGVGAQAGEDAEHTRKDIQRHRAIAAAHEAAAQCFESGKSEEVCHQALQAACKGLAIGKYCGMRHEH